MGYDVSSPLTVRAKRSGAQRLGASTDPAYRRSSVSVHPSRINLEPYSVDDLPAADREEVGRHLLECGECRRLQESLAAARAERLERVPAETFVARVLARGEPATVLPFQRKMSAIAYCRPA